MELPETPVHAQERLLRDLACILFVPHQTQRNREDAALVTFDQRAKGSRVAGLGAQNEATIAFGFVGTFESVGRGLPPPIHLPDISIRGRLGGAGAKLRIPKNQLGSQNTLRHLPSSYGSVPTISPGYGKESSSGSSGIWGGARSGRASSFT